MRDLVLKPFTGDLDAMVKRRLVRIGVTFNRTFYFLDKGVQRGIAHEYGQLVEERLNTHFKTGLDNKIFVAFLPLPRAQLLPALVDGKVDLAAAQLTVRPALQKFVDFTNPTRTNVSEIVVTAAGQPPLTSVADLSGREVFVREKGTYHESLLALNEKFKAEGKPPVEIRLAPDNLEDDDLLEMVNAGLIPAIVVDDYLAGFWKKVFTNLTVHDGVAVRTGGTLAVAIRKNSPQLSQALNTFMGKYGLGTAFGNVVERKYLVNTPTAWTTCSWPRRDTRNPSSIRTPRALWARRDHAGHARDRQGAEGRRHQADRAEHPRWCQIRARDLGRVPAAERAVKSGLDPNAWFGNVEVIAAEADRPRNGDLRREHLQFYVAYSLVVEASERKAAARAAVPAGQA